MSHSKYQNFLLSLLLLSGGLKVFLSYYKFPFDFTVLVLGFIVIDIFLTLAFKAALVLSKTDVFYVVIVVLFYFITTISLAFTPSFTLGLQKITLMLIPLISFFYVKIIKYIDLSILYKTLLYGIVPIAIWFVVLKYFLWNTSVYFDFRTDADRFGPLRNSYLSFGYLLGVLSILSLNHSKKPLIIILMSALIILGLGSRGALLFLVLTLLIVYFEQWYLFFKNLKIKKRTLNYLALSLVPIAFALIFYFDKLKVVFEYGLIRFTSLINATDDSSLLGRFDQYKFTISECFSLKGFTTGYGLGSFGLNYLNDHSLVHPHNIFLEAWYELGFFAMCLLIVFFILPFFHLRRKQVLFALALYALLNAMKTLSFSLDRNLFILFAILIFHKKTNQNYINR